MIIYKEIKIDLDYERKRINKVKYTKGERKVLHAIVDAFEAGDLDKCRKLSAGFEDYVGMDISDILFDTGMGATYCVLGEFSKLKPQITDVLKQAACVISGFKFCGKAKLAKEAEGLLKKITSLEEQPRE